MKVQNYIMISSRWHWLRQKFAPPTFEDEQKTRMASVLNTILWVVIFAMLSLIVLVLLVADDPWVAIAFFGIYMIPSVSALFLMRQGKVRTGILAFIITLWVGLAVADLVTPPEEASLTSYMTIIVMAGLLLKGRGALQFTIFTIILKLLSIPLDRLIGVAQEDFLLGETVSTTIALVTITVLLYIASNSIDNALDRARRNEKALSEKVEELEETSVQLAVARDEALAASRAKSEFLANMSHEIRTPLNAVVGMTELMMDTSLNEKQLDFAETIHVSSNTLLRLINDILDFSKIEANRLELEYNSFDLRQCIESAMDMMTTTASNKGLELAYLVDAGTPGALIGDVTRVRQVLVNLLSNAVKFTEQGEVVVNVSATQLENGRFSQERSNEAWYEWHFSVRDTGIGIAEADQSALFESFTQLDASTTRQYGGTGLGLAISRRLVDMMNGRIWIESQVDVGSTFHFTIIAQAAAYQPPEYLGKNQPSLRGKRILIVDDNATNRKIVRLQTQMWGMEATEAASGAEALTHIEQDDPFDLAILDMSMPQMDGLMLAEEIRHYRDKKSLPLIMLTSVGMRDFDERLTHFAAFLTKPLKAKELYNVLAGVLSSELQPEQLISTFGTPFTEEIFDSEMGQRHPLRILMAEDNEFNRKMTVLMLERLGYETDVAVNGKKVIEAIHHKSYDVVLMDVQMPIMDGLTATRRIRRAYQGKQPYIIALTADVVENARERCLAAGMDDYVSKPLSVADLVVALNKVTTSSTPTSPADPPKEAEEEKAEAPVKLEPTAATKTPNFDPAALERMKRLLGQKGDAMLPTLVADFHKDANKLLNEMEQGVAQSEPETVRRAAHSLKSNSAHFGMIELSAQARAVEMEAKANRLDGITQLIVQTRTAYEEAQDYLNRYIDA